MPTSADNGTQSATVTTEHTLGSSITTAGTYVLMVNTTNMVAGDELELRAKVKVLTGGSETVLFIASYAHAQSEPIKVSIPVVSLYSVSFTLKQTAGTSRNFEWNIISL
jgi:hypothetical protein